MVLLTGRRGNTPHEISDIPPDYVVHGLPIFLNHDPAFEASMLLSHHLSDLRVDVVEPFSLNKWTGTCRRHCYKLLMLRRERIVPPFNGKCRTKDW